jgi:ATP-binding cassette subfamily F protein uup
VELSRLAATRLGKTVVELADVSAIAADRVLLDHVTWQLGPGDRVGIVGVNGSGKTTVLRLLAGVLPVPADGSVRTTGTVVSGTTVQVGYLTQEPAEVDPDLRVLAAAEQVRSSAVVGRRELTVSQLLERLGLTGSRQWTRVGDLSGGERRRLQLLLMLLAEPNVLLLDEPTNDLDIETLTELEDLLDGWPGSVVVVSHDRYFLERVTDHILGLVDGQLAYLPGGVDEYLTRRARTGQAPAPAVSRTEPPRQAAPGPGGTVTPAQQRAAQKELARLERQIARLSDAETRLAFELAGNASDYARLVELGAELRTAQDERANLEERWLQVAEMVS